MNTSIIIAGPCAAETQEQVLGAGREVKNRSIPYMRACLWKPRTKPGFDGVGSVGIAWHAQVAQMGVAPATEVLTPEQATIVIDGIRAVAPDAPIMVWIGARNQNHQLQQGIAQVAAAHDNVTLMVKNQPWIDEKHMEGVVEHAIEGGMPPDRLILCHRGFTPQADNPHGYRNLPDHEMAMRIKHKLGVRAIVDPSHIGGTVENVFRVMEDAKQYDYDGMIIEVHPDPEHALTDAKQQLTWSEYDKLISLINN